MIVDESQSSHIFYKLELIKREKFVNNIYLVANIIGIVH